MFKRNPGADQSENHAHGVHPRFTCLQLTQQWLCWIDFEHYLLFRHSQAGIQQELTCFHWLYVTLVVIDHATAGRCGLSDSNKYVRWKENWQLNSENTYLIYLVLLWYSLMQFNIPTHPSVTDGCWRSVPLCISALKVASVVATVLTCHSKISLIWWRVKFSDCHKEKRLPLKKLQL